MGPIVLKINFHFSYSMWKIGWDEVYHFSTPFIPQRRGFFRTKPLPGVQLVELAHYFVFFVSDFKIPSTLSLIVRVDGRMERIYFPILKKMRFSFFFKCPQLLGGIYFFFSTNKSKIDLVGWKCTKKLTLLAKLTSMF